MKKLSIIVPCFNAEKTIVRTLNSIKGFEDFKNNFEIIIVNDGSTDSTLELIIDFFKENNFIYLIKNQSNLGLSEARNNGLKIAKGKYIWFVDSDDEIISDKSKLFFSLLKKDNHLITFPILRKAEKVISLKNNFISNNRLIGAQFYIYKRDFLIDNNLFFVPRLIHEDLEFLPRVFSKIKSIYKLDFPLYKSIYTKNSITTSDVKFLRVKSLIDIAIYHNIHCINGSTKYFGLYSMSSLNRAFSLSFKLNIEDSRSLKKYLNENIKLINSILKIKSISTTKLKSLITILFFNLKTIGKNE